MSESKKRKVDSTPLAVSLESVQAAYKRVKDHVKKTPVLTSRLLDDMAGRKLFFKCEPFQTGGAFKYRGACSAVFNLDEDKVAKGVVAHSSGNHAQAVALAAKARGIPAIIVMPNTAPQVKVDAVKAYGADIRMVEESQRDPECRRIAAETGATIIHPSNDPDVISGQGTIALEFLEQMKEEFHEQLDAIIVPVGGGGMISGIAVALKELSPKTLVIGAEPAAADDAFRSKEAGELLIHKDGKITSQTVADGLKTTLGSHTFPVVQDKVDQIILVSEKEIVQGMKVVMERLKVVLEPSAGTGIAVALSEEFKKLPDTVQNIGIVLCGGNVDLKKIAAILNTE